jgi:tetrahydromethanopterin S-methyltransferase subunit B
MADSENGQFDIDDDFEWGFSFSDNDDGDLDTVVTKVSSAASADLGPVIAKLDAILALIPEDAGHTHTAEEVDLTSVENKLDQIIALERLDALTAGDLPDMSPLETKLDTLLGRETTVNAPSVDIDLTEITDKLDVLELTIGEVRELDFNGDGSVDFGDINNNLADLLVRQETVETELEAKKEEFINFKANKLKALEKLIVPLLRNLKSNPDKAYIHWPNRAGVLDAQIAKILGITR